MNNYEILGLPKDASEEQVRAAYKELALKWHPDRRLDATAEATAKFVEINTAYKAVLRERRRAHRRAEKEAASSDSPASTAPSTPKSTSSPLSESHSSNSSAQEPAQNNSSAEEPTCNAPGEAAAAQEPLHSCSPPHSATSTPLSTSSSLPGSQEDTASSGHGHESPAPSQCHSPRARSSPMSSTPSTPKSAFASLFSFSSGSSATSSDQYSTYTPGDELLEDWEDLSSENPSSKCSTSELDQEGSGSSSKADDAAPTTSTKRSDTAVTSSKSGRAKLRKQSRPADRRPDPYSSDFTPKTSPRRRKTDEAAATEDERTGRTLLPEYDHPLLRGSGVPKEWVYILTLSLEELFHGKNLRFRIVRHRLSGKRKSVILDVHVPPGCQHRTRIIFKGSGHERNDGTRQDIVFLVEQAEHPRFTRVNDDLVVDVRLPWVDSLMQEKGEVNFDGVDGKPVMFKVNFPRDKAYAGGITIPHAGMPLRDNASERGKLVVRWEIVPVSSLSKWETMKNMLRFKT